MPYYPRVSPSSDATFDAIVDAHYAEAIHVSHGYATQQDAQAAAEDIAKGLNLRDYEALVAAGFTEADLPAAADEQVSPVEPLTKVARTRSDNV